MTLDGLRTLCVGGFKGSSSRNSIMDAVADAVARAEGAGLRGDLWVDGSFLTRTWNPDDADLLLAVCGTECDVADNHGVLKTWLGDCDNTPCDAYVWYRYPEGHPQHYDSSTKRVYWHHQFGLSRSNQPKGIAILTVGGGL